MAFRAHAESGGLSGLYSQVGRRRRHGGAGRNSLHRQRCRFAGHGSGVIAHHRTKHRPAIRECGRCGGKPVRRGSRDVHAVLLPLGPRVRAGCGHPETRRLSALLYVVHRLRHDLRRGLRRGQELAEKRPQAVRDIVSGLLVSGGIGVGSADDGDEGHLRPALFASPGSLTHLSGHPRRGFVGSDRSGFQQTVHGPPSIHRVFHHRIGHVRVRSAFEQDDGQRR